MIRWAAVPALVLALGALPAAGQDATRGFQAFQAAVSQRDKAKAAELTVFPLPHPSGKLSRAGKLTRAEFLARFEQIFSPGMSRQIAKGYLHKVTPEDVQEAKDDESDPCGQVGEYVVQWPPEEKIDLQNDDEAFLHPVFRMIQGRLRLTRIIGCS